MPTDPKRRFSKVNLLSDEEFLKKEAERKPRRLSLPNIVVPGLGGELPAPTKKGPPPPGAIPMPGMPNMPRFDPTTVQLRKSGGPAKPPVQGSVTLVH